MYYASVVMSILKRLTVLVASPTTMGQYYSGGINSFYYVSGGVSCLDGRISRGAVFSGNGVVVRAGRCSDGPLRHGLFDGAPQ